MSKLAAGAKDPVAVNGMVHKPIDIPDTVLVNFYESMLLLRHFDRRAVSLQRAGRIGTYPPLEGQEACQVGAALALRRQDFLFPTYRDYGAMMLHGVPMHSVLLYWNGRAEGCEIPDGVPCFPIAVPIATQLPHAAGAAWAAKLRGLDQVSLAFFGDGASSEGDFHEALNFAGVFHLPVIFFCENNQYAISVPLRRQTASETIAQKADAYGVRGVQVDGSDVIAVYRAVSTALQQALAGEGPTLIEALTYRYGAHTTSDDPSKYRSADEEGEWRTKDPLAQFTASLQAWGLLDDARAEESQRTVEARVADAVATMESIHPPRPEDLFAHVYAAVPPKLVTQQAELQRLLDGAGTERGQRS